MPEDGGALKMIDLTLSPDDKHIVGYGKEACKDFTDHLVDPSHVEALFRLGGQLTVYKGPITERFCNIAPDATTEAIKCFRQLEESKEHSAAIATWNDDDNCNGHSVIRFNLPIDIKPLLQQALSPSHQPAPPPASNIELDLFKWSPRISKFSNPNNDRYDDYFGVRGG